MKPEEKVPTLEQCKRLVEIGVVLKTERYWETDEMLDDPAWPCIIYSWDASDDSRYKKYPAPDVAELGMQLPNVKIERSDGNWWYYFDEFNNGTYSAKNYKTEAKARCAALIWLIENGYFKPETLGNQS